MIRAWPSVITASRTLIGSWMADTGPMAVT